jgi:hypothetical protein
MDVVKFFEIANKVEDMTYNELKEFDKLVLFKFLFDNHIKALIDLNNLSEDEIKKLNRDIKKTVELLNKSTGLIIDRRD